MDTGALDRYRIGGKDLNRQGLEERMRSAVLALATICGFGSVAAAQDGNPEFDLQYGLGIVAADRALERGHTGAGVPVAVFDTGLQIGHPEFAGRIGPSFDIFTQESVTFDDFSHGTHVTGIIGASRDGRGMMGVAPDATLIPVRILSRGLIFAFEMETLLPAGYAFAVRSGARIMNNSWASLSPVTAFTSERFAATLPNLLQSFRDTARAGAVMVWGTGNNAASQPRIQAGLPHLFPELQATWLAVTAVGPDGLIASYANACGVARLWCLAAPGGDFGAPIVSTVPTDAYGGMIGTSMATPHVSGALAVGLQIFPEATGAQLAALVLRTATDVGDPGVDDIYGWGLLNVGNLVDTIDPRGASAFAHAAWARFATLDRVGRLVQRRLSSRRTETGLATSVAADPTLRPASDGWRADAAARSAPGPGNAVWIAALRGRSEIAAGPASPAARAGAGGGLAGIDLVATDHWRLGIAGGLTRTELETRGGGSTGQARGHHLLAYADWAGGAWFSDAVVQLASFDQTITRRSIPGTRGAAISPVGISSMSALAADASLRAGRGWTLQGHRVEPYVHASATWQELGAGVETGADIFSLALPGGTIAQFQAGPGVRWSVPRASLGAWSVGAELDASYARRLGDLGNPVTAELLGRPIRGRTADTGRDTLQVGSALSFASETSSVSGEIGYHGAFRHKTTSHAVSATFTVRF